MTKHEKKTINELLRQFIILRDSEKCLRCGRSDQPLAMSHIYPKGTHRSMEYEPDNLKLLCAMRCHICWWHKDVMAAHEWLATAIPKARLDKLKLMANTPHKVPEYKLLKLWLEQEIKKMKRK